MKPELLIQKRILENQILIMEQMLRETSYPGIKKQMEDAIEETKIVIRNLYNFA